MRSILLRLNKWRSQAQTHSSYPKNSPLQNRELSQELEDAIDVAGRADHESKSKQKSAFLFFSPETYFERNKGFAQQAGNRTRGGRRVTTRVGLCGSKGDACPPAEPTGWPTGRRGAEDLRVILRVPGTSRTLDSRPPATISEARARPLVADAARQPGPEQNCPTEPGVRARSFRGRRRTRTCARRFLAPRRRQWPWESGDCGSGGPAPAAGPAGVSFSGHRVREGGLEDGVCPDWARGGSWGVPRGWGLRRVF